MTAHHDTHSHEEQLVSALNGLYASDMQRSEAAFVGSSYYVNALLEGISWTGTTGVGATVTYNFTRTVEGGTLFNASERAAAVEAMQRWSNVANIRFQETTGTPELTFSRAGFVDADGLTTTIYIGSDIATSEVQLNSGVAGFTLGGYGFFVMLHELGHALGLKHTGQYNSFETPPFLPAGEDNNNNTVMSYNFGPHANQGNPPVTPMIYDIAAVQYLYGANTSHNAGNTTYNITGVKTAQAIWDGGGTDTMLINTTASAVVDLREGASNMTSVGQSNYWVAFGANIENATGNAGNDVIYGNGLANFLQGGGGADRLHGGRNNDELSGNQGNDTLAGEIGDDLIRGGQNDDAIYGGQNNDTVAGDLGNDTIYGDRDNDSIYGGQGNDVLLGGDGNDYVSGDRGNDQMNGGAGNDIFFFTHGSGVDTITSFDGAGGAAGDQIYIATNINGLSIQTVGSLLTYITYNTAGAVIDLGGGNSIGVLGVGTGGLMADDFVLV